MELNENNIWEVAEAYVNKELHEEELNALKELLATDADLKQQFDDCLAMLQGINSAASNKQVRKTIQSVQANLSQEEEPNKYKYKNSFWRTAAIAASIAIVASFATYWVMQYNNNKIASQYSLLRRDLETYKRSQNRILKDIKEQTTTPYVNARYSGTGFALSNDGLLVTNYHVVKGADSIYIQTKDGEYYKAATISYDKAADVVIMKVESDDFKFGKYSIPYKIAAQKRKLGAKVYTLGFPQDEIVYNEGYISAKNGYQGDSLQYRLEIPAGPGQSGAPVVDERGNVIGIITGKELESQGVTYAVSSKAIVSLLDSLPDSIAYKAPYRNKLIRYKRERQIELLEQYTCAIKVYKR